MDTSRAFVPRKTIQDLCSINGNRTPPAPPLPANQTPNLESIQKVYDVVFAQGLDKFLETGTSQWFVNHGFNHLVSDRELLFRFLLYLTVVSNQPTPPQVRNGVVASEEARVVWALLNLVLKPAHEGNEEAEKFARRIKAVEALLTGEPSMVVQGSMADFINQEDVGSESDPTPHVTGGDTRSTFGKQVNRRSEDFWKVVEKFAEIPRPQHYNFHDPDNTLSQARKLLDGMENRDILYSMMLLATSNGQEGPITSRPGTAHDNGSGNGGHSDHHHHQQVALARRLLETEDNGRATNTVSQTLAGMAVRAFSHD